MISNFWWGKKIMKMKIDQMGWSKLCWFENEGGMGLQDLKLFSLGFGLAEIFNLFVILVYFSYYL